MNATVVVVMVLMVFVIGHGGSGSGGRRVVVVVVRRRMGGVGWVSVLLMHGHQCGGSDRGGWSLSSWSCSCSCSSSGTENVGRIGVPWSHGHAGMIPPVLQLHHAGRSGRTAGDSVVDPFHSWRRGGCCGWRHGGTHVAVRVASTDDSLEASFLVSGVLGQHGKASRCGW